MPYGADNHTLPGSPGWNLFHGRLLPYDSQNIIGEETGGNSHCMRISRVDINRDSTPDIGETEGLAGTTGRGDLPAVPNIASAAAAATKSNLLSFIVVKANMRQ